MKETNEKALSLFEAYGVELEYMVVSEPSLDVCPKVDILFEKLTGNITSLVEDEFIDMDNELAAHVVELKNPVPTNDLIGLKDHFQAKIQSLKKPLQEMQCTLIPSAMHPWMDPIKELKLWPHGDHTIYHKLHEIFDCKGHGWANLQSTHLNLPFSNDEEFHLLHSSIRAVLPLVPMLAASSPYADGVFSGVFDKRLITYRDNSKKVFSVTGHVIPEVCTSQKNYHENILQKIWNDLDPYDPEGVLKYEWINARGAIARFDRMAIEIRLIDIQEAPCMDLTFVSVLIDLIKHLVRTRKAFLADKWSCQALKAILERGMDQAEYAKLPVDFMALFGISSSKDLTALEFFSYLTQEGICQPEGFEANWQLFLSEGTLASRMMRRLGAKASKSEQRALYGELGECLFKGIPFVA